MAHKVFISYAAEDKAIADAVCGALEACEIKCWYAPRDVPYGLDFDEAIVDAICASRLMILILSSHSNKSAHVKREIQNACMGDAPVQILPFRVEDLPLNKALRYYIGAVHWLDAVTPPLESHLNNLVQHVEARLPRTAPLPMPRAWPTSEEPETAPAAESEQSHSSRAEASVLNHNEHSSVREEVESIGQADEVSPGPVARPLVGQPTEASNIAPSPPAMARAPTTFPGRKVFIFAAVLIAVCVVLAVTVVIYRAVREKKARPFEFQTMQFDKNGRVTARKTGTAKFSSEDLGDGVTLEMVEIPGGKFLMGTPAVEDPMRARGEGPQHEVNVPAFLIGKYEITQAQWRAVSKLPKVKIDLDFNPSHFKGDDLPVEGIEWKECEEFCERVSRKTGHHYRLPTEAEWEYACRAGTTTPFAFGETITLDIANFAGYSFIAEENHEGRSTTIAVGVLGVANGFGLYDMHGNVAEWCLDGPHFGYSGAPTDGSAWYSSSGEFNPGTNSRILRGGDLGRPASRCRCGARDDLCESCFSSEVGYKGFRVVLDTSKP